MTKWWITAVGLLFAAYLTIEASLKPYRVEVHLNNGSSTGQHGVVEMFVTTVSGGGANFAMGAVSSYPGKYSSGGKMSAPSYIEGYWAKGWEYPFESYHRISAKIPEDAEAKMKAMDSYYLRFHNKTGSMQVIVDGPRVRVFYTKYCSSRYNDCTPRVGADPNGWVTDSPHGVYKVVVLFDGIGESSATPFPDTHFADLKRRNEKAFQ